MVKKDLDLENVKIYLDNFGDKEQDYSMLVVNKITNKEGYASIVNDNKVAVFEGRDDGSDDNVYNNKKFEEKYKIKEILKDYESIGVSNVVQKVVIIEKQDKEYHFNAKVLNSYDNGENFVYTGKRQFFKAKEKAKDYKRKIECKKLNEMER